FISFFLSGFCLNCDFIIYLFFMIKKDWAMIEFDSYVLGFCLHGNHFNLSNHSSKFRLLPEL
ncbi:MAG: hypothetical protein ABI172_11080, partial [Ginsengibacter sp.]